MLSRKAWEKVNGLESKQQLKPKYVVIINLKRKILLKTKQLIHPMVKDNVSIYNSGNLRVMNQGKANMLWRGCFVVILIKNGSYWTSKLGHRL